MPKLIRDIADTSGYWAAAWTMCMFPDVHVIYATPIGCYNLVAVAVSDYTDAIPRLDNITPSVIREEEVGGSGTGPAVQRTFQDLRTTGKLDGKQVIIVSTAESEMIGSDLSSQLAQIAPGSAFYYSNSLAEDEWAGRDRALLWLWQNFGRDAAAGMAVEPGTVNIIGPTYGCFNSPADLHEVRRLIEGAGGRINLVVPAETSLADLPKLARTQVNVVLREYGHGLADALGQPWLHAPMGMYATTEFIEELGRLLGSSETATAFIRHEKRRRSRRFGICGTVPRAIGFPRPRSASPPPAPTRTG
ncbi:MAG: nitrogenase component 1 [Caldilineaceae bacterium]